MLKCFKIFEILDILFRIRLFPEILSILIKLEHVKIEFTKTFDCFIGWQLLVLTLEVTPDRSDQLSDGNIFE